MTTQIGDQRIRRRVTTVIASSLTSTGVVTRQNPADILYANRHYVSIIPAGTVTGGTITIRCQPVGATSAIAGGGFSLVGMEALNLATLQNWTFDLVGFFDAFLVNVTGAITGGGSVSIVVNSTIED